MGIVYCGISKPEVCGVIYFAIQRGIILCIALQLILSNVLFK